MTSILKSEHLWPLVDDFTKPRPKEYDEEGNEIEGSSTPDWVARAMLDDLRLLQTEVARLTAEGHWQPVLADDPNNDGPVWVDENGCVCWAGANGVTQRLVLHGDMRLCLFVPGEVLVLGRREGNDGTSEQSGQHQKEPKP